MSRTQILRVGLAALSLLVLAGLALAGMAWAGSSNGTAVDWSVLSGGGAPVAVGSVTLNGSLGQTGIGSLSGPGVTVGAGFWYRLGEDIYEVYLPLTLRNYD